MIEGPQIDVLDIRVVVCPPNLTGAAKHKVDVAKNVAGSFTPNGRLIGYTPVFSRVKTALLTDTPILSISVTRPVQLPID